MSRMLGDQRIFQSIVNDLGLNHEEINGKWVYAYGGVDPYQLEDKHFPTIEAGVQELLNLARIDAINDYVSACYKEKTSPNPENIAAFQEGQIDGFLRIHGHYPDTDKLKDFRSVK